MPTVASSGEKITLPTGHVITPVDENTEGDGTHISWDTFEHPDNRPIVTMLINKGRLMFVEVVDEQDIQECQTQQVEEIETDLPITDDDTGI